jgi:LPS-assembly protein
MRRSTRWRWVLLCVSAWLSLVGLGMAQADAPQLQLNKVAAAERVRTEIPYRDGTVVLLSDFQERVARTRYRAVGRVEIVFKEITITCDQVDYDDETRKGMATGHVRFSQGQQWLTCSKAEFDFAGRTGTFYDASGYTDQQFMIRGRTIRKTGPDTYSIQDGFITSCPTKRPKWSFSTGRTDVRVDKTARLHQVIFKIKGVPVFYAPYLIVPMQKKERSGGLIPFHTGNSTTKGRLFSEGWFQPLGPSMDMTVYADYFTLRGLGTGGIFRARPNDHTQLFLQAYGIHDKLGQGGAHLIVEGDTLLKEDFRAVARVNITSSFQFRQAFSDTFRSATIPQEAATVFLTRNHDSTSMNVAFERQEVLFPVHSLVIRKFPSAEFNVLPMPLGRLPVVFELKSSLEGVSRADSMIATPKIMQRLDFYPRLTLRLPSFAGFSLLPSVGVRETYYSAHADGRSAPEIIADGFRRRYADFELDLRTPTLTKQFQSGWLGTFTHTIEPALAYRRITGIENFDQIIRFDDQDAIANTHEVEYGLVNRFFRNLDSSGGLHSYEFLSLSLMQKYYFDPTFGGAFVPGEMNIFYPLDTLTGFSNTSIERNLSPVSVVARFSPKPGISHDLRTDYDTRLKKLRDVSLSTFWQEGKVFIAGTYFKTKAIEPGSIEHDQLQAQAGYGSPLLGLSASLTLSYNIHTSELLNSQTRLNYMWDCCGLSMEFQQFSLGLRTESRISFSFTLKGIGSFGNIKRPESLF